VAHLAIPTLHQSQRTERLRTHVDQFAAPHHQGIVDRGSARPACAREHRAEQCWAGGGRSGRAGAQHCRRLNQSAVDTAAYKWVTTACPADHPYVVSGGYVDGNQAVLTDVVVRMSLPTQDGVTVLTTPGKVATAGNGWSVLAVTGNGGPANAVWRLDVFATCSS
jgi:hypothetical protein